MLLKNVYFFQPNVRYGDTLYLPYASGVLAAFAWACEDIKSEYALKGLFCLRDDIDATAAALENPFLVAFSNYIWNFEYNKALAQKIKEIYPESIVVFGGHNIPDDTSLLAQCPYIDILNHGEGEEAFRDILLSFVGGAPLSEIANISYRDKSGNTLKTKTLPVSLVNFPSPYTAGLFDSIIEEHPEIRFSAIMETNRGCPYGCAFCDWCELDAKVRLFPEERVLEDLQWMAENNIEFCYCADANFGMFKRDEVFVDKVIELNRAFGYPQKFRVNYAKNNNQTVFSINQKLNEYGISKGATISFQSLSTAALENIGRKNMSLNKFSELMTLYRNADIPTYTELILGLPGETYESFCSGIGKLLEAGQHTSILIYNCELIVNSLMANEAFMKTHGIKTAVTPLYLRHDEPKCGEVQEFSKSVIETATMSNNDWIRANLFSVVVQSCHGMGLLRWIAVWLFFEKDVGYVDFYQSLITWAENNPKSVIGEELGFIKTEYEKIAKGNGAWSSTNKVFGNVAWPYEEALYLNLVSRHKEFYEDILEFLKMYKIDNALLTGLFNLQKSIIKIPGVLSLDLSLDYDFPAYFAAAFAGNAVKLDKRSVSIKALDEHIPSDWQEYAKEYVWFGRKEQVNIFNDFSVSYDF